LQKAGEDNDVEMKGSTFEVVEIWEAVQRERANRENSLGSFVREIIASDSP